MSYKKKLRVLVYGDIGGSGGYESYCKGLFGSGVTPKDIEVIFVCSTSFYNQLKPLDTGIKVVHHSWPSSPFRFNRYLWHLVVYPNIVRKYSRMLNSTQVGNSVFFSGVRTRSLLPLIYYHLILWS